MSLLFETILCVDGKPQNLFWHTIRVNKSRSILFNKTDRLTLEKTPIPEFVKKGKWKCRVLYDEKINGVSFEPYQPLPVKKLKMIQSDINYSHKFEDRTKIDELYEQKGDCDDVIIIKKGLVTDTSIANILLFDGHDWLTPESPLLEGIMRAELISKKVITPKKIAQNELPFFSKIMLVNAMNPFDEARAISLSNVY